MLKVIDERESAGFFADMRKRDAGISSRIEKVARDIMEDVRSRGLEAVNEYSERLDGSPAREISHGEIERAYASCGKELISALEKAAGNIRDYQQRLLQRSGLWLSPDGGTVGQLVRGLRRVGLYVPGGTAAYPSSVLMNAIPAKVAGVSELIMVTPPTEHMSAAVLAAAKIAGVDRVIAVGGAQAVAALTCGAGFIPKVDKLVGPGNAYVAAAKRMAYGELDIDMVAGPSEVLVIADSGANPDFIAADLLSQAEHDVLASAVLLTDCTKLAVKVAQSLETQAKILKRYDIIKKSIEDHSVAVVCDSLESAAAIANAIAPEHLEIMTREPEALLPLIENAGAVFLGEFSPEPLGDYMAGPSHVLPTSGTARFFSPLSAETFLKRISVVSYGREALERVRGEIELLASSEQLTAHGNSIRIRFEGNDNP